MSEIVERSKMESDVAQRRIDAILTAEALKRAEQKYGFSITDESREIAKSIEESGKGQIELYDGTVIRISPQDYLTVASLPIDVKREERFGFKNIEIRVRLERHWSLQRYLCGNPECGVVTFRNGDQLDFRRENLLISDKIHKRKKPNSSSQYLGVSSYKTRWTARLMSNGKVVWLGYHDREIDAAKAYDKAARQHFGLSARFNFPQPGERSALEGDG